MSNIRTIGSILDTISITHKFEKKKLVFLNTSDVLEGKILIDSYMDVDILKGQAKKTIKNDDILFSEIRPKNKRYAYVKVDNPEDYVVSTKLMVLRNKTKDVLTKYVYYFLTSNGTLSHLQMIAENRIGSFPQITYDLVKILELNVPDISKQQKIVDVISTIDNKIEVNNSINANLEELAKTLYNFWFVQFDFPDKNGKPYKTSGGKMVWNEELKRQIPEGWEVRPLSKITKVSNESINPFDFPEKEFKHYSIPAFDESGTFKSERGSEIKSNKFVISDTDILVSKLNPWFNRIIYSTEDCDLISSTEFVVWRTKNTAIKNYMYMIARDASFITYCTQSATGTSNSHKRVNPTVMMKYQIVFNEKIAEDFGKALGATIKMYAKNKVENNNLSELRSWLLPMLMNGQVNVK